MESMYPRNGRVILHVDMNSFYASVEMAVNPALKDKVVVIAGNPDERRGIIITCNYHARALGIKTTMTLKEARRLAPHMVIIKPDFEKYREFSIKMFEILNEFSDLVEPVSVDEGYVDITDCKHLGDPISIAEQIQQEILHRIDLPCSIGIAPNKFLAKTASDMKKPMGITILRKRDIPSVIWPLAVEEMHGIGEKTGAKLRELNIQTIGDLAAANDITLKQVLGINGLRLKERANGNDPRTVDPQAAAEFKSIGNSTTLPYDVTDERQLIETLQMLCQKVAVRLKKKHAMTNSISIMIRYKDWRTVTRSKRLNNPLQKEEELLRIASQLFLRNWDGEGVRLVGVTANDLLLESEAMKQLDLFNYETDAKQVGLLETMEELNKKFGGKIVSKASHLLETKESKTFGATTSFSKDFLHDYYEKKNKK